MSETKRLTLANAWIALHRSERGSAAYNENFWAFTELFNLCRKDPERAWALIGEIRHADGSEIILANLAAGPLEDLLARHGPEFIARVESLASGDAQFRKLLGALWQNKIRDEVWSRIQRVAGPSF